MRKTKPDTRSRFSHIIDCQHLCLLLKKLPPEDSLSIDELDDFLDLLGVETSIDNLFLVFANLKTIAAITDKVCKHPRWRFAAETIRQAQNTAEAINKSRKTLGKAVHTRLDKEHNKSFDGVRPKVICGRKTVFNDVKIFLTQFIIWQMPGSFQDFQNPIRPKVIFRLTLGVLKTAKTASQRSKTPL